MQCSKEEALLKLFNNLSSFFFLFFLFLYFSSILIFKFFYFIGTPIFPRNEYEYEYDMLSEEEEEEEEYRHVLAESLHDEVKTRMSQCQSQVPLEECINLHEPWVKGPCLDSQMSDNSVYHSPSDSWFDESCEDGDDDEDEMPEELTVTDDHSTQDSDEILKQVKLSSRMSLDLKKKKLVDDHDKSFVVSELGYEKHENGKKLEGNLSGDEKFFIFAPTKMETKKVKIEQKDHNKEEEEEEEAEIFGDSCTVGSTSKSSSEWRSSINCRDSGTEDPFSSSSRRSCPKWESYTVFQKYDEEMMFLDRISAQKLHETESLRSIQMCPRSISERIVHKISSINKKPKDVKQNPYHELEAAYVAQICLTWEALNWNYKNFLNKRGSRRELDCGCSGKIAQQFQQFLVLLQRYIENEPFEHGRRPEIYARMRLLAPNLLQVPEYIEEDPQKEECYNSRLSSPSFLMIMEDGIRTFMNFLKADKEKPCQIVASFFKRKRRGQVDPALLQLMKKVNQKKRVKLKDLRRAGKCIRKRKITVEEEMEIVMGLIDLKVVARVLRMADLSEEQLHWCEAKMSKVRIMDGKLHRDSSPLFFPPTS